VGGKGKMSEVNRFGIEPVESYLGYIVIEILDKHKKELIAEFLTDINIIDNLYGKESITIFNIREKWEKRTK